jgi:hypothetical protein
MAPTKQHGPKEKFLKKVQSFSDTLYFLYFLEGRGGRRSGPATLPHSCADCFESGTLNPLESLGPAQACYKDCFTFTFNILVLIVTSLVGATMSQSV